MTTGRANLNKENMESCLKRGDISALKMGSYSCRRWVGRKMF